MATPPDYPGAPRWVKALGVLALVALLVIVGIHLSGGGLAHLLDHGGSASSSPAP